MKRIAAVCLLLAGCSTAPVADLMDHFAPGRLPQAPGYHGGVGTPQPAPPAVGLEPPLPPPAPPPSEPGAP